MSQTKRLEGKGIVLGTSKKIVTKLEDLTEDELGKLHRLFYKESSIKAERKMNILAFCGLEQNSLNFEKEKVRITKNLQKKMPSEREKLKDVFHLKTAEVEDILAFIVEPFRPDDDEELEFKDEGLQNGVNDEMEEVNDDNNGEKFDVSGDDGDLYNPDDEDEEEEVKKPKRKVTRSTRSKKCAK